MLIKPMELTLNGQTIILRSAQGKDAEAICEHRAITAGETYYMARYPEECEFDVEESRNYLAQLEQSQQDFHVTAFLGDRVIGDLGVTRLRDLIKYRHRGYLGISIQKQYCDLGLGSRMVELAVQQARENGFEQLELGVFSDNTRAIHLYEKYGFKQYGIQPRAFKLKDGTYRDELIMVNIL